MKNLATILILFCASVFAQQKGTFTDPRDGKVYKTVKTGEQTWLAENLNYEAEGSVCYENNPANCAKYGRLYNWETAKKVCPKGWHLPSNAEWDKLLRFVNGDTGTKWDKLLRFVNGDKGTKSPYGGKTAGKYLKAANGWNYYSGIENLDTYGFSALPGGASFPYCDVNCYPGCSFSGVGYLGGWWSTNEYKHALGDFAYYRGMGYGSDNASWQRDSNHDLRSVRCLQD